MNAPVRRPTNLSLDPALVSEARDLGINLSRACEDGLAQEIARERSRRWLEDNAAAIASSNAYVDKYGLPLARHRLF